MGKNNNKENAGCTIATLIIIAVLVMIYLMPIIIPILFLIIAPVNHYLYVTKDKEWLDTGFWLTDYERNEFITYKEILRKALETKNNIQKRINAGNVKLNVDGSICRRSDEGKETRAVFENANNDINKARPVVDDISHRPYKRWRNARRHYSNAKACRVALEVFVASLLITSWFSSGNLIHDFGKYIKDIYYILNSDTDLMSILNGFTYKLWIIFMVSMVVYIVIRLVKNTSFSKMCSEPPIVTLNNIDTYIGEFKQQKTTEKAIRKKQEERRERLQNQEKPNKPARETAPSVSPSANIPQRSKEENLFITWADVLRKGGYEVVGNWDNWENAGQWKNMAIVSSINNVRLRINIEYDAKSKQIYFGIAKLYGEDTVSQELLNSEKFRRIMSECGLSVKNNEWWYCMKFSSFDNIIKEYQHLIDTINNLQ